MRDRRALSRAFAGVLVLGALGALLTVALRRDSLAFTLGVPSVAGVAAVPSGSETCQNSIAVPPAAGFDRVGLRLGTYFRRGPEVRVTVRVTGGGRTLARGRLAGGYPDIAEAGQQFVALSPSVPARLRVDVCVANRGSRRVAVFGAGDVAAPTSTATLDGRALGQDLDLVFERSESRSVGTLTPAILGRASLFRPGWVGSWTYVVLALVAVAAVPWFTLQALRRAVED